MVPTTAIGCVFNISNAGFTAAMANATGFGEANELDIMQAPPCTGDFGFPAQSGAFKIGLHQRTFAGEEAFSLELTSPVIAGQAYTLTFFASQLVDAVAGPVEVGLSSSATDFGTLVATGLPLSAEAWTEFTSTFVAPVDAAHLTVRQSTVFDSFSFVDNFQLGEPAECFLVLGSGPGITAFDAGHHVFWPQVEEVLSHHAVLRNGIPSFPVTSPAAGPSGPIGSATLIHDYPDLYAPQQFYAQVLMWNPEVFPQNPEQWTRGMRVVILGNGQLFTRHYGDSNGEMTIRAETFRNEQGETRVRFPFLVTGF